VRRLSSALLVLGVTAVAGLTTTARAADLPTPGPYAPPPAYMPAIYNWTGFYFGAHVGVNILTDDVSADTGGVLLTPGPSVTYNPVGVIGGGQIGANYQTGAWVLGVEGTIASSNVSGSAVAASTLIPGLSVRSTSALHWVATATGRVGYAFNTLLLYAKGGGAWAGVQYFQDVLSPPAGPVFLSQSNSSTRIGWTAGLGLEYGLTEHVSGRLEYDFMDFGTQSYPFALVPQPMSIQSYMHEITVAVSYRFN